MVTSSTDRDPHWKRLMWRGVGMGFRRHHAEQLADQVVLAFAGVAFLNSKAARTWLNDAHRHAAADAVERTATCALQKLFFCHDVQGIRAPCQDHAVFLSLALAEVADLPERVSRLIQMMVDGVAYEEIARREEIRLGILNEAIPRAFAELGRRMKVRPIIAA